MHSTAYFALLDDARHGRARLFQYWQGSDTLAPQALAEIDDRLRRGWQRGWHALLWLPYEFGLGLHGLDAAATPMQIHWFARQHWLNADQTEAWLAAQDPGKPSGVAGVRNDTGRDAYVDAIGAIHQAIARGDTYQINYTTRLHFAAYGDPAALYRRLRQRQPVPYGALARLPDADGATQWTLCLSPELFLHIGADGQIRTQPMKGTAPILGDGGDAERARALQNDAKNRAENVMIVDLLRNDLGRIAATGAVSVPEAFAVNAFGSVWQMTSTVTARPRPGTTLADIVRAAFPCGSITGAPKRMSMQLISQIENSPRGLYTGSIGHMAPCRGGLGFSGSLNVVIRTLQLQAAGDDWRGNMGVGSGIVIDSEPHAEYAECQWKSRFLTGLPPRFALIETLAVRQGHCPLLPLHQQRLARSVALLHFAGDSQAIGRALAQAVAAVPAQGDYRVRLVWQADGHWQHEHAPLPPLPSSAVLLHPDNRIRPNLLSRHKTSHRAAYDHAWQQAQQHHAFDTLLFDADGFLLEGGRSNVFVRLKGCWHTPSAELPLLPGVMRQAILADPQRHLHTHRVYESRLHFEQVAAAEEIRLCNALRGLMPPAPTLPVAAMPACGPSKIPPEYAAPPTQSARQSAT